MTICLQGITAPRFKNHIMGSGTIPDFLDRLVLSPRDSQRFQSQDAPQALQEHLKSIRASIEGPGFRVTNPVTWQMVEAAKIPSMDLPSCWISLSQFFMKNLFFGLMRGGGKLNDQLVIFHPLG
jgi:hypothetical protein